MLSVILGIEGFYQKLVFCKVQILEDFVICIFGPMNNFWLFQSAAVANMAYVATLTHSKFNREAENLLKTVIMRSQKPLQFRVASIPLSMETFGIVS